MEDRMLILVTGVAVAVGGVLVTLFLEWLFGADRRQMKRILRGPKVTAQVVGVTHQSGEEDPIYGGGGGGYAPLVSFHTTDGTLVTAGSRYIFGPEHRVPRVGTALRIHYDPSEPSRIYIKGWDAAARVLWIPLAVGPLLTLVGLVVAASSFIGS